MQQMSSQENSDPQEINRLGERYHLGAVQGAYYVTYTQADIHRYRMIIIYFIIMFLFLILDIVSGLRLIFNFFPYVGNLTPFVYLGGMLPLAFLLYSRRKWGNRPAINPENCQERVYLYQDGLIKLTAKRCDVVRWSQMYDVIYTLPMVEDPSGALNPQPAGIRLSRYSGRKLTLSGALGNFEDLVRRVKRACDQISHGTVHTDKLDMD